MHMGNGVFRIGFVDVEDVCSAAVCVELAVHGKVEVSDAAILAKDLSKVVLIDILGQLFHHDLGASPERAAAPSTTVAVATRATRPRPAAAPALAAVPAIAAARTGV